MIIKEIFDLPIDRNIETVIKADDRDNVSNEVAEYVITREIGNKIRDLFSVYRDYSGVNGVWISGFFGSGKSHLLKILSYVLENKISDGYPCGELFADKIEDDAMLRADVLAASKIPSESILFNIDQQALIKSKSDENAILSVFYKIFYDHLGFYGYQPHVAEFEMWLKKNGQLDAFAQKFNSKSTSDWKSARMDYFDPMVTDTISEVLAELNGKNTYDYDDILDVIEEKSKQSIDHFCEQVLEYVQSKGPHFRLNFFVDEVGQYISDNTKLMLNLQTIAETLAVKTKGRSWILVTSQEDMEKVVGDMNRSQQNDFSKIQARFKIKIPLTSANVDEVIEKRLLKKKPEFTGALTDIYQKDHAHLDTLISFSDSGVQFKGIRDAKDYVNKFPFLPYQFDLFQQCRRALSTHNAFQGKHTSVGERSMLGVFQQVIKSLGDKDENALVPFDLMFQGIRNELKGEIQSSINLAENNLSNSFAVRVLKTLFLIKYYSSFKSTKRNISVLMIDSIKVDLRVHDKQIDEALNQLESQNYIQRNSDIYEFLTDDEKDIEAEIKDVDIDDQAKTQQLKDLFFDEVIRDNKLVYADNRQSYDFATKVDGALIGRDKELGIEIITDDNPDYANTDFFKSQTMSVSTMKMVLPENAIFIKDLRLFLQTNKYIKQSQNGSLSKEKQRIIQDKQGQNQERRRNLMLIANQLLSLADVYIHGSKQELNATSDGRTRVVLAFQILIKTFYPNLRMLGAAQYTEDSIRQIVHSTQSELFDNEPTQTEAESEIVNIINRRKVRSERTKLSDLKEVLGSKPYGWYPNAVWAITAKLFKRGVIELKQDANLLDNKDALIAFLNSSYHATTQVEIQQAENPAAVKALKMLYSEFFHESCPHNIGKEVANAFKEKLKVVVDEVHQLVNQKRDYPFLSQLETPLSTLRQLSTKNYSQLLEQVDDFKDHLLDIREDVLDPINTFMKTDQRKIYDEIRSTLNGDTSNFEYVEGSELETLKALVSNTAPYRGTFMREAKTAKDALTQKVLAKIEAERAQTLESIGEAIQHLQNSEEFAQLEINDQQRILAPLQNEKNKLPHQRYIGNIRDSRQRIKSSLLTSQLNEIQRLAKPVVVIPGKVAEPKVEYIRTSSVKLQFDKRELRSEADVEEYIQALRAGLIGQIRENKRISL
ncbi:hypothetical protein GCM10007423_29380 [Dyadobacter endophyticus]|uniref:BREX system P-loop protein BrxC n=1 Tax=Dyadobacter endophyticus TaxID=1749036 RepID=A0ABQ1YTS0_9BACT|nr:BREX system P-loop protein BrxC [Dyadobacter endophyticus]GGH36820.1 hypothetical protein GCM10007423_29380 [Dyadobacter endophyticus]